MVVLLVASAVSCVLAPSGNRRGEQEGRWRVRRSGRQEAGAVTQSRAAVWGAERVCLLGQGGLALGSRQVLLVQTVAFWVAALG